MLSKSPNSSGAQGSLLLRQVGHARRLPLRLPSLRLPPPPSSRDHARPRPLWPPPRSWPARRSPPSHGPQSNSCTALYTYLVNKCRKYTGVRDNDFTAHGYGRLLRCPSRLHLRLYPGDGLHLRIDNPRDDGSDEHRTWNIHSMLGSTRCMTARKEKEQGGPADQASAREPRCVPRLAHLVQARKAARLSAPAAARRDNFSLD
jgi:hypothetical protein